MKKCEKLMSHNDNNMCWDLSRNLITLQVPSHMVYLTNLSPNLLFQCLPFAGPELTKAAKICLVFVDELSRRPDGPSCTSQGNITSAFWIVPGHLKKHRNRSR